MEEAITLPTKHQKSAASMGSGMLSAADISARMARLAQVRGTHLKQALF
jgi:hypothetical protein